MDHESPSSLPSRSNAARVQGPRGWERVVLAGVVVVLTVVIALARQGVRDDAPMDALARRSPDLATALANGRPTLVEFYADWCEACRAMVPALLTIEKQHHNALDVVMLNADNPRWQPELDRHEVNGIPQLELFDADGKGVVRSLGARSEKELSQLVNALLAREPLPPMAGVCPSSALSRDPRSEMRPLSAAPAAGPPRSHA